MEAQILSQSHGTMSNSFDLQQLINPTIVNDNSFRKDFNLNAMNTMNSNSVIGSDLGLRSSSPLSLSNQLYNTNSTNVFSTTSMKPITMSSSLMLNNVNDERNINSLLNETSNSIYRSSQNIANLLKCNTLKLHDFPCDVPTNMQIYNDSLTFPHHFPSETDSNADIMQYDIMNELQLRGAAFRPSTSLSHSNLCDDLFINKLSAIDTDSYLLSRPIIGKYHSYNRHQPSDYYFSSSNPCLNSSNRYFKAPYDYYLKSSNCYSPPIHSSTPLYSSAVSLVGHNPCYSKPHNSLKKNFLKRHVSFKNHY